MVSNSFINLTCREFSFSLVFMTKGLAELREPEESKRKRVRKKIYIGNRGGYRRDTVTKEVTTCSELERFGYCPLSWWRSRKGIQGKGKELQVGIRKHKNLEVGLTTITNEDVMSDDAKKGIFSYTSITIILAFSGIFIILFGVLGEQSAAILIILALVWLLVASYFFYRMLKSQETSEELRKEHGVPRGRIDYSDSQEADSLFSKKHMLSGKPDYIIEKEGV